MVLQPTYISGGVHLQKTPQVDTPYYVDANLLRNLASRVFDYCLDRSVDIEIQFISEEEFRHFLYWLYMPRPETPQRQRWSPNLTVDNLMGLWTFASMQGVGMLQNDILLELLDRGEDRLLVEYSRQQWVQQGLDLYAAQRGNAGKWIFRDWQWEWMA
jgi:hypothetical protein